MIDNKNLQVGDVILSVKDLCKYFGNNKVLTGINIDIKKGDVVAIVGPSGCGKSTFLRCLNLLETPNAGEIVFEGDYVYKLYSLYSKEKINEIKAQVVAIIAGISEAMKFSPSPKPITSGLSCLVQIRVSGSALDMNTME